MCVVQAQQDAKGTQPQRALLVQFWSAEVAQPINVFWYETRVPQAPDGHTVGC